MSVFECVSTIICLCGIVCVDCWLIVMNSIIRHPILSSLTTVCVTVHLLSQSVLLQVYSCIVLIEEMNHYISSIDIQKSTP